jgi:hypothetical protein
MVVRRLVVASLASALLVLANGDGAAARTLKSSVTELAQIPSLRPEFPVPKEPNMLFYIQRSVNSNTVIYAARLDAQGRPDRSDPIEVYWRWYNVDGHRKPLNFIERNMAYGVSLDRYARAPNGVAFKVEALPERKLFLQRDSKGGPEALIQIGNHLARLVYVYLQVDDRGWMPDVTSIDLFGVDTMSGKALHEHVARS